jgi:GDPmannose 4,6-dehydratase
MLQQDEPGDYVVATGLTHSVRELCEVAFSRAGLRYEDYVRVDEKFIRPAEVDSLVGNPAKISEKIGWKPQVDFAGLIEMMVDADIDRLRPQVS